jgi:hypothetical protein
MLVSSMPLDAQSLLEQAKQGAMQQLGAALPCDGAEPARTPTIEVAARKQKTIIKQYDAGFFG